MTPFGVPSAPGSQAWIAQFAPGPPPALTSKRYAKDYNELKRGGSVTSDLTERPQDRADVARFYAAASPSFVFNLAARQVAAAEGSSLSKNARALALLNMASNDSLVVSFWTKYHYKLWRPETAIFEGNLDGNPKTAGDITYKPFILTPCFPSYPSNHGSGSNSAAEVLIRAFGAGARPPGRVTRTARRPNRSFASRAKASASWLHASASSMSSHTAPPYNCTSSISCGHRVPA